MTAPHPQSRASLLLLKENLQREAHARHVVQSTLAERIEWDRQFRDEDQFRAMEFMERSKTLK